MRRYATAVFLIVALAVVGFFMYVSDSLARDLSRQEHERMQIWADATREIVNSDGSDINFLLSIIEANRNIPVLLTDEEGNIKDHRNFRLPEPIDPEKPLYISEANLKFLQSKLEKLKTSSNVIKINLTPDTCQYLYYEDSSLLKRLNYFPYIQLGVMVLFVVVVYFAVSRAKQAEQNKVWVGLSKETAHQLGTPITSLMAWVELLPGYGVDNEVAAEMQKDVNRLASIASRFSKIGSRPTMDSDDLNRVVRDVTTYMKTRISRGVSLSLTECEGSLPVSLSAPLMEWVMENLIKNAVDAMEGSGNISVTTSRITGQRGVPMAAIDVTDTGKGIARRDFKTIFRPGFTTKKRGWGLGLTLAKRIVEQYHGGKIFVAFSHPYQATTFRIILPISQS